MSDSLLDETHFLASLGFRVAATSITMDARYFRDDDYGLCKTVDGVLFTYYPFKGLFQAKPDQSLTDPSPINVHEAERLKANYDRHYAPKERRGGLGSPPPPREGDCYFNTALGLLRREVTGQEFLYNAKANGWMPIDHPEEPRAEPLTYAQMVEFCQNSCAQTIQTR